MLYTQLNNRIKVSFFRWFDHVLCKNGGAYETLSGQLYSFPDERLPSYYTYSSSNKQWVADSSVGAYIPPGYTSNSISHEFNEQTFVDWDNGRIISSSPLTEPLVVTYSTKDFNLYITNESEEKIIFQNTYLLNDYYEAQNSGIAPYEFALPACFVLLNSTDSSPYSMGSSDFQSQTFNVKVVVITNNSAHLDGCFSVFQQQVNKNFALMSFEQDPFNEFGGIKSGLSGVYNYNDIIVNSSEIVSIERVQTSTLSSSMDELIPQSMLVGFINFKLNYLRTPE
jgi:hypothetical protein